MSEETKPTRVDEERAAAILDRAARLDAGRAREVDLDELREAALEAGISPAAFERALIEVQGESVVEPPAAPALSPDAVDRTPAEPSPGSRSAWPRRIHLATGGAALGVFPFLMEMLGLAGEGAALFSMVVALQLLLWLIYRRGKDRAVMDFELDLMSVWSTLTLTLVLLVSPIVSDELVVYLSIAWMVAALIGGVLVRFNPWADDDPDRRLPERT